MHYLSVCMCHHQQSKAECLGREVNRDTVLIDLRRNMPTASDTQCKGGGVRVRRQRWAYLKLQKFPFTVVSSIQFNMLTSSYALLHGVVDDQEPIKQYVWWPRGAFPTAKNTSERRRPSVHRRSDVGVPLGRRRSAVGPPYRRTAVGAKMRAQARERGYQYMRICVYV